jgi:hypothetical protein
MSNTNAFEAAALDRIRELVQNIRPLAETQDVVVISPESMEAILEVQEIVFDDFASIDDDADLDIEF